MSLSALSHFHFNFEVIFNQFSTISHFEKLELSRTLKNTTVRYFVLFVTFVTNDQYNECSIPVSRKCNSCSKKTRTLSKFIEYVLWSIMK
eukprot:UN22992